MPHPHTDWTKFWTASFCDGTNRKNLNKQRLRQVNAIGHHQNDFITFMAIKSLNHSGNSNWATFTFTMKKIIFWWRASNLPARLYRSNNPVNCTNSSNLAPHLSPSGTSVLRLPTSSVAPVESSL